MRKINLKLLLISTHCLLSCLHVQAQNSERDSLKSILLSQPHDSIVLSTFNNLCRAYWSINVDSSIHYGNLAVDKAEILNSKSQQANAFKNLSQAYIYSGNYQLAKNSSKKAFGLYKELNDQKSAAVVLRQFAVINMYQGEYDSAATKANLALQLYEVNDDLEGQAESLNTLGNIHQKMGNYPLASDYLYKSLMINQEINNPEGIADVLNNIGVIYEYQQDYKKALENYQKSYMAYLEIGDKLGLAIGLHNAGVILRITGNYDSAIYNFETALELDEDIGSMDGVAYDKMELGETYLLMNDLEKAFDYLQSALKLSEKIQDPVLTVPTLIGLGIIHQKRNNIDSAFYYLKLSLDKAEQSESKSEKMNAAKALYELYELKADMANTLKYFRTYTQIKGELFSEENIKNLALVEAEYEFEQRRNKEELEQKLNGMKKDREVAEAIWVRNTSIAGVLVLSMLVYVIYFSYRRKRRANKTLNKLYSAIQIANEKIKDNNSSLENKITERTQMLQEQNEKLKNYLHSNSHDVRAPLARILALIELYNSDKEGESTDTTYINDNIYSSAIELDEILKKINETLEIEE